MREYDVIVIGGGPAGLAAAISADKEGARVLLIEREARLGGILKQCIHDGFGLVRFGEKLTGPEYAERFIEEFYERKIGCLTLTFVTEIQKKEKGFLVTTVNRDGMADWLAGSIVLATGCRERTAKQVFIHGTRPAGVFTAGTAQHFTNLLGEMPTRRCVILGSGDIGLIMARRLTLEGAKVLGVYEVKPSPSGLTRNLVQCLEDYDIPLYLSHTVTRVFGEERLTGVEISQVDEQLKPVPGTSYRVDCDALILSVGLIPENEMASKLGVTLDARTKGPVCDEDFMTDVEGVFSCGNALHVNDLVDYVSESGELAGQSAAAYVRGRGTAEVSTVDLEADRSLQYLVPQRIHLRPEGKKTVLYFRSGREMKKSVFTVEADGRQVFCRTYAALRPPEMERIKLDTGGWGLGPGSRVTVSVRECTAGDEVTAGKKEDPGGAAAAGDAAVRDAAVRDTAAADGKGGRR